MTTPQGDPGRPGWLIDEVANAGRENLDAEHVQRYDGKEDAGALDEVALLHGLDLNRQSVVVDLGSGTGQFALAVAPACAKVIAVDVSPAMLETLRSKIEAGGFGNIDVVQAGFLTYHHAAPPADIVYSRYALHHLPDAWKAVALAKMRMILKPGGLLRLWDVVYDFEPQDAEDRFEAWCAQGGDQVIGEWSRAEYEEHVRDEHSTFTWLLEPMIQRAGFTIEQAQHSEDGMFARYILRANRVGT